MIRLQRDRGDQLGPCPASACGLEAERNRDPHTPRLHACFSAIRWLRSGDGDDEAELTGTEAAGVGGRSM